MKIILVFSFAVVLILSISCKGRDKCATCPTFSEAEQIEKKQI